MRNAEKNLVVPHEMVHLTCLMLWFLSGAVVVTSETKHNTETRVHAFKQMGFISNFWHTLIILKEYTQFYMLCFVNGIAFNLSVQSESSLSPGFVQVGSRNEMKGMSWFPCRFID